MSLWNLVFPDRCLYRCFFFIIVSAVARELSYIEMKRPTPHPTLDWRFSVTHFYTSILGVRLFQCKVSLLCHVEPVAVATLFLQPLNTQRGKYEHQIRFQSFRASETLLLKCISFTQCNRNWYTKFKFGIKKELMMYFQALQQ